jgi:hypothetical protein
MQHDSTIPADLLELKGRFDLWRATRKYKRETTPEELRRAALEMSRRYPPALVGRVLKLDPSRLKKPVAKPLGMQGGLSILIYSLRWRYS